MIDQQTEFEEWWSLPEHEELRKSCAQGWGWQIWQASRAAVIVDIPSKIGEWNTVNGYVLPEAESYDEAIDDCAYAIREAGISVKEDE
ncbi:hypothetical protein SAMN05216516_12111 [Izhakiella capsodis]|uniref:Uncharacterized protein n=1 Tax=Izhakiella capsodis TaxID=1367852 RepID=A0A1I5BT47_9GAMM|nr:hypothetical protein [Izhakiella capsodis]SFN77837.1 hypothetical protein SAMN05216516_12111 [Izhakiella capsodis]